MSAHPLSPGMSTTIVHTPGLEYWKSRQYSLRLKGTDGHQATEGVVVTLATDDGSSGQFGFDATEISIDGSKVSFVGVRKGYRISGKLTYGPTGMTSGEIALGELVSEAVTV